MPPDVMAYNVMVRTIRNSRDYEATNVFLTVAAASAQLVASEIAVTVILYTCYKAFLPIVRVTRPYKDYSKSKHIAFCHESSPHVGGGPPQAATISTEQAKILGLVSGIKYDNS